MLFYNFCLFHFSKFKMTIVKNLIKNNPVLNEFQKLCYGTNNFDPQIFDNEMTILSKCFEICTEMGFVSLLFLNKEIYNLTFNNTFKMYYYAWC